MTRYRWDKKTEKMVEAPARREDLARSGCREVDPSERDTVAAMRNPEWNPKIEVMTNE